ncbi:MAG: SdrD B-like domain-containing protein, partial [Caldilineaceae bacterium]
MSVQQEHLTMKQAPGADHVETQVEKPPKLEYSVKEADESLEAYISAISGAIIGVLATLLVLYILNGGTLRFTNPAKLSAIEASLTRVDENVGAVNQNVGIVAERLAALEGEAGVITQLQTSLTDLDSVLTAQSGRLEGLDESVAALNVTRKNFDTFTAALASALSEMGSNAAPAAESANAVEAPVAEAAPAAQTPAETAVTTALVTSAVAVDPDLAADAVQVMLFVDANGDGALDDGEAALVGATVTLTPAQGEAVNADSTDTGALFEGLSSGEYTLSVESVPGYTLDGETSAAVTVDIDAEAGQVVYFA